MDEPDLASIVAGLGRLRSRYGVHFVTGNHEYYSGVNAWTALLDTTPAELDALR